MKTIYLVCATGIATSSMLRVKIEDFLRDKGIEATVQLYRIAEMFPDRITADVIVSTTEIPPEIEEQFTCINGLGLITGIGEQEIFDALEKELNK